MSVAVAVTWHARPGTEERIEAIFAELRTLTDAEPGCIAYVPHRAIDQPDVYFIYEQFADEGAFNAHLASEYYRRLVLDEAVPLLHRRERFLYAPLGSG